MMNDLLPRDDELRVEMRRGTARLGQSRAALDWLSWLRMSGMGFIDAPIVGPCEDAFPMKPKGEDHAS